MNGSIPRKKYGEHGNLKVLFNKYVCLLAKVPMPNTIRILLYSLTGMKIGKGVFIASYVLMDDQYPELITIQDHAVIAYRVAVLTHDDSRDIVAPVTIQNGAFLGACSIILPGVVVGERAVVGAGTTTAKDVPANSVIVGASPRILENSAPPISG